MKDEKPANPHNRTEPLRSRASVEQMKTIQAKANKFCEGNVSEWLRIAAVKYEPSLQESKQSAKIKKSAAGKK